MSYAEHCQQAEDRIVARARASGGETWLSYGDEMSASVRLTEKGIGHWKQHSPFVATFVLASAGSTERAVAE